MRVVVLTGASRGLGASLADRLLSASCRLVCIARSPNPALEARARACGAPLDYRRVDLADRAATMRLAEEVGETLREARDTATRFVLVHDAGVVEPIVQVEGLGGREADAIGARDAGDVLHALDADALERNLQVNLVAGMRLAAAFLRATDDTGIERRILNISSGAGRKPMPGWSAYCSAKAALDMFSRCIAAEQQGRANPARVVALAPGVIDTGMQATIRGAGEADFPSVRQFRALKTDGSLASPQDIAARIVAYLDRDDFGGRVIDDIREYRVG